MPTKATHWKSIPIAHWQFAREMRKESTPAEVIPWDSLKQRKLGVSFRRQHPIGPFIADFFASSSGLVVEVDGEVHAKVDSQEYDSQRDDRLASLGLKVIRFTNEDVMLRLDWVLERIRQKLRSQSPDPEPQPPAHSP